MDGFKKYKPKYENENSYDMKDRLSIDAQEERDRASNYLPSDELEEEEIDLPKVVEQDMSPMQKKIMEDRDKKVNGAVSADDSQGIEELYNNIQEQSGVPTTRDTSPEDMKMFLLVRNLIQSRK
jgi:hypothetical protein